MRWVVWALVMGFAVTACGPQYVRDTDVSDLDEGAMSTGLDRADLERLFDENLVSLTKSAIAREWGKTSPTPTVAIEAFVNDTSEHIDPQLQALLSKLETKLINSGAVQVMEDASMAQFRVTGKAYDSAEKTSDARRVQYFLFMQVVDTQSGAIRWQNEASLTKALLK